MTPQIDHLRKMSPCSEVFSTQFIRFLQEIEWIKHSLLQGKTKHVTPQIDDLGKTSPTVKVFTTYIY